MFIYVAYKDAPELSQQRRQSSDVDLSVEKTLLVNPVCPVRIMLEHIRKKCALGMYTEFDLCDDSGYLKGLFNIPTYEYVTDRFEHKHTYYVVVIKQENDRKLSVLPQLNHENCFYEELKQRIKKFIETGHASPVQVTPPLTNSAKSTPVSLPKGKKK